MLIKRNKEIGQRWFLEMWGKPDLDLADELVDKDYSPEWVSIDAVGPDQIKHEIKYFRSAFPDLKYKIVDILSAEDRVWVRYKGKATHKGNAWGFEPTNREFEFEGAAILHISSEGKVVDRWGAFCFYDILMELELVPPFWELSKQFGKM